MTLGDRPVMTSVQERDVDLLLVQLVATSPAFRQWVCNQLLEKQDLEQFLSVSRSVETGNGESDIEIGIETTVGERVLLLLENKVDATVQENQAQRYYERGSRYVETETCDRFAVGLVAPADYVSDTNDEAFGTVITYESILTKLDSLAHESAPFVADVLGRAIEKQRHGHGGQAAVTEKIEQ